MGSMLLVQEQNTAQEVDASVVQLGHLFDRVRQLNDSVAGNGLAGNRIKLVQDSVAV